MSRKDRKKDIFRAESVQVKAERFLFAPDFGLIFVSFYNNPSSAKLKYDLSVKIR